MLLRMGIGTISLLELSDVPCLAFNLAQEASRETVLSAACSLKHAANVKKTFGTRQDAQARASQLLPKGVPRIFLDGRKLSGDTASQGSVGNLGSERLRCKNLPRPWLLSRNGLLWSRVVRRLTLSWTRWIVTTTRATFQKEMSENQPQAVASQVKPLMAEEKTQ